MSPRAASNSSGSPAIAGARTEYGLPPRENLVFAALVAALLHLLASPVFAQGAAAGRLEKVTAMYGARSGASWPLWLAKEGGYYRKYGLEVDLVFGVHPAPIAAVISGHAVMTSAGADPAILALSKDGSLEAIGSFLNKGSFALIGAKNLTQIRQLSGKKMGVGRVGDPPYHISVSLLKKFGVNPKDVQWVSIGVDAAARAAALQTGQIDATLITAPAYFRLESGGFPVLALLSDHEDIFVSTYYLFLKATVTNRPALAEAFVKAHAEAIKRFYDDKPFAARVMIGYGGTRNEEDAGKVYDLFKKGRMFDSVPYILKGSVSDVVERQSQDQPYLRQTDFSRVINNGIVDRLVREGFFENLFGPSIREEQQRKQAAAFGR